MSDQPSERHRRSLRLKGYDYAQAGAYFVTICAHNRKCLFGEIENGLMRLNEYGDIVASEWLRSVEVRAEIECGEFVVMPNHVHGIVRIVGAYGNTPLCGNTPMHRDDQQGAYNNTDRAYCHTPLRSPSRNLGAMVRGFKSTAGKCINEVRNTPGAPVWQRNYFEHVIRNDDDYNRVAEYVANNPQHWMEDSLHP
jgi:REP element-mobilizing transposase RayT